MGRPVVHFEILGQDAGKLQNYYSELFGWNVSTDNPVNYGMVSRDENLGEGGAGIGGGIAAAPEGHGGHVTFYVAVPDVEQSLARAEQLGGSRAMGPEQVVEGVEIGMFFDPEGHLVGVVRGDA